MANIAIPGAAVTYRALLFCVSHLSTGLSTHGVGVEPLLSLDLCAGGGGTTPQQVEAPPSMRIALGPGSPPQPPPLFRRAAVRAGWR